MITVKHSAIDELIGVIGELETLTSQPRLSKRDESRHAFLLAKISLLKSGISVTELRNYERESLLRQAGLPRLPEPGRTQLDAEIEREWRNFARGNAVRPTSIPSDVEVRANEAGTQTLSFTEPTPGGYFVPQGFYDRAFESMKAYDQIFDRQYSNVVETDTGANMPFPVWDDVANASVQVGETVQSGEVDVANFGSTQLNAYSFRSKIVAVSLELLEDSNFPFATVLERVFAMRHARGVGAALITGSGVSAPTGLLTGVIAAGAPIVIAAGASTNDGGAETGANSVGTQDLNNVKAKLDPAYRPGACWYMNTATLDYLEGLLDKQGRPIVKIRDGLNMGVPFILGHPVAICPSMPTMGSAKNTVVLGNPANFVQRRVPSSMYVRRFWQNPTLVQYGLVGFESWLRVDSGVVAPNASFSPFVVLQQHS